MTIAEVYDAARRCRPCKPGASKVYICDVAEVLGDTVSSVAPELLRLRHEGLELSRADMPELFDAEKLRLSQVDSPGMHYGYQLLRLP
ncbi:MAG TPA: hypothetical protein VFR23_24825 [Jiangellaceae bacterium]|nr:hypothetical protein [Jiangellaceae bacterium]